MNVQHIKEAQKHIAEAGERTRALLVCETTHEGEMHFFKAGTDGDIAIMTAMVGYVILQAMTVPKTKTPESGAV